MSAEYTENRLEVAVRDREGAGRRKVIVGWGRAAWERGRAAWERAARVGTGGELQRRGKSILVCSVCTVDSYAGGDLGHMSWGRGRI